MQEAMERAKKAQGWATARLKEKGVTSFEKLRSTVLDDCRSVASLLASKSSASEASEYKQWAMSVAEKVAATASEGGFLGFGGEKISTSERQLLSEIRGLSRGRHSNRLSGKQHVATEPRGHMRVLRLVAVLLAGIACLGVLSLPSLRQGHRWMAGFRSGRTPEDPKLYCEAAKPSPTATGQDRTRRDFAPAGSKDLITAIQKPDAPRDPGLVN